MKTSPFSKSAARLARGEQTYMQMRRAEDDRRVRRLWLTIFFVSALVTIYAFAFIG